jgi:hypothetical protein
VPTWSWGEVFRRLRRRNRIVGNCLFLGFFLEKAKKKTITQNIIFSGGF